MENSPLNLETLYHYEKDVRYAARLPLLFIRFFARFDMYTMGIHKHVKPFTKQAVATRDHQALNEAVYLTDPNGDRVTDSRRGALEFSTWHNSRVAAFYWIAAYGPGLQAARAYRILVAYSGWFARRHGLTAAIWGK